MMLFHLGAMLLPLRDLHLGPMRVSPYGLCAAAGVLSAMALAGHLARRVRLDPEKTWDAGLFAILCCFGASRLLLVVSDVKAFLRFPLLVLSLPSLTIAGMALAALAVGLYLRRKGMAILPLLDVFAAPAALLAALLELGHWLDGSEIGMPIVRGRSGVVGFQPVSVYGVVLALGLLVLLWRVLGRMDRAGRVAGLGLMLGGLLAFALDVVTLPELFSELALEPGQMVALAAMLAGAAIWTFAPQRRPASDVFVVRAHQVNEQGEVG